MIWVLVGAVVWAALYVGTWIADHKPPFIPQRALLNFERVDRRRP